MLGFSAQHIDCNTDRRDPFIDAARSDDLQRPVISMRSSAPSNSRNSAVNKTHAGKHIKPGGQWAVGRL
jgi:hypothetical protein